MCATVSKVGDIIIIRPRGNIHTPSINGLRSFLEESEEQHTPRVALDCSQVHFIDSSGLGLLVNYAKRLRIRQSTLCLVQCNEIVRELIEMTGLEEILPVYENFIHLKKADAPAAGGEQ